MARPRMGDGLTPPLYNVWTKAAKSNVRQSPSTLLQVLPGRTASLRVNLRL
jgi:hypothetical protein